MIIQVKKGLKELLKDGMLQTSEFWFCTDTGELYIGSQEKNILIGKAEPEKPEPIVINIHSLIDKVEFGKGYELNESNADLLEQRISDALKRVVSRAYAINEDKQKVAKHTIIDLTDIKERLQGVCNICKDLVVSLKEVENSIATSAASQSPSDRPSSNESR